MKKFYFTFALLSFFIIPINSQWQQTSAPTGLSGAYALSAHGDKIHAGISSQGVYISTDNGVSWIEKNEGLLSFSFSDFAFIDNYVFVSTKSAGVFRTTENDIGWTSVSSGLGDLEIYALTAKGEKLFAGAGGNMNAGVYVSEDNGNNWTKVSNGLLTPAPIRDLASNDQYLFAGVYGNGSGYGVFSSTDDGNSWIAINNGITNTYVWRLQVKEDKIFAGMEHGSGGIFVSYNQGALWEQVNSEMTDSIIQSFAVSGSIIFAGTYTGGVILSRDDGQNWVTINEGLTNLNIQSLTVDSNFIYAGAVNSPNGQNGIWRRPLSDIVTAVEVESTQPKDFLLFQNYPNPFNPSTTISFSIPGEMRVSLAIYDLLGREIKTLVNDNLNSGEFKIEFTAKNLPSGLYIYKLSAGKYTSYKKLLLLK